MVDTDNEFSTPPARTRHAVRIRIATCDESITVNAIDSKVAGDDVTVRLLWRPSSRATDWPDSCPVSTFRLCSLTVNHCTRLTFENLMMGVKILLGKGSKQNPFGEFQEI